MSRHRIVLLGPPASGKGTVAQRLSAALSVAHISTGQMFREAIAQGGPLGEAAEPFIDKGQLVPDDITMQVVKVWLEVAGGRDGFILDGFPRTIGQAHAFDALLQQRGERLSVVVLIELPEEETLRRVSGRLTCSLCGRLYHREFVRPQLEGRCDKCGGPLIERADDTVATARIRLTWYRQLTLDVVKHYEQTGQLKRVDGGLGTGNVYKAVLEILKT